MPSVAGCPDIATCFLAGLYFGISGNLFLTALSVTAGFCRCNLVMVLVQFVIDFVLILDSMTCCIIVSGCLQAAMVSEQV